MWVRHVCPCGNIFQLQDTDPEVCPQCGLENYVIRPDKGAWHTAFRTHPIV